MKGSGSVTLDSSGAGKFTVTVAVPLGAGQREDQP